MSLVNAAHTPPTSGPPDMTVQQACAKMAEADVAALGVVDENGKLVGLFQEQDLVLKVIPKGLDPAKTPLSSVMAAPPATIVADKSFQEALATMLDQNLRHVAVTDDGGRLLGIVSIRSLMEWKIDDLDNAVQGVTNYFAADGIGGG